MTGDRSGYSTWWGASQWEPQHGAGWDPAVRGERLRKETRHG